MSFRKSNAARIGGKFLVYGDTGTGKSFFALTFPKIACIDSEVGMAHYEGRNITLANGNTYNNLELVDNTSNLDTLEEDLDAFLNGEYKDKIKTLCIDSETKFYSTMQIAALAVEEKRAKKKSGNVDDATVSKRQWGRIGIINMKFQRAKIDLSAMGVHIVSIAQATNEYKGEGDNRKIVGTKGDMYSKGEFDYDTILEFYKEKRGTGFKYFARVKKDRSEITKVGQIIENPCYDIWKEYYEAKEKLPINKTSYKKDIQSSTDSMNEKADESSEIVDKWKIMMKQIKKNGNTEGISNINNFIKEKEIDVKKIDLYTVDVLTELVDFTELQLK